MTDTLDFSKPVTKDMIKCRYPGCEKDGIIPMFEGNTINLRKVIPYCAEHASKIMEERKRDELRKEILKMKEEGLL